MNVFKELKTLGIPHAVFATESKLSAGQVDSYGDDYFITAPGACNVHLYKTRLRELGFKSSYEFIDGSEDVVFDNTRMIFSMKRKDKERFNKVKSNYHVASNNGHGVVYEYNEAPLKKYMDFLDNPRPVVKFAFSLPMHEFIDIVGCDVKKYVRWKRSYIDNSMGIVLKRRIGLNFYTKTI